jgi:hypothetical protein
MFSASLRGSVGEQTVPLPLHGIGLKSYRGFTAGRRNSKRHEHVGASNKARSHTCRRFRLCGIPWALALNASPQFHQQLHPDADRVEHSCAVTMMDSGGYNHVPHPSLTSLPLPTTQLSTVPALTPQWVESPFLGARIFEHAPPCS